MPNDEGEITLASTPGSSHLAGPSAGKKGAPGWFALRPPLSRFTASQNADPVFRTGAGFAQAILARFSALQPSHPAWKGSLRIERQAWSGLRPAQPVFHRLVKRLARNGVLQPALRTLSLPLGFIPEDSPFSASLEDEPGLEIAPDNAFFSLPAPESSEQTLSGTPSPLSIEYSSSSPWIHTGPAGSPAVSRREEPAPIPPVRQPARSQPSKWPFQLLAPSRAQPDEIPARRPVFAAAQTGMLKATLAHPSQPKPFQPSPGHPSSTPVGPSRLPERSYAVPNPTAPIQLSIRPIAQVQARMPTSVIRNASRIAPQTGPRLAQPDPDLGSPIPPEAVTGEFPRSKAVPRTSRVYPRPHSPTYPESSGNEAMLQLRPIERMFALETPDAPATQADRPERAAGPVEPDWPLFGVLRQLESAPPSVQDSTALRHLRRIWPDATFQSAACEAFRATSRLGPGAQLEPELRQRMETHLGQDLGDVRLHTSPLVQTLRAEAFTSGRNIVFAPGKLQPTQAKGLALLAHELTHLGQPLAFKPESGTGALPEDQTEHSARQQEAQILQIVEQGWPEQRGPEYQRRAPAASQARPGQAIQRAVQIDEVQVSAQPQEQSGGAPAAGQAASSGGSNPGGQAASPAAGGAVPPANLDAMARQVYNILKDRLRAERSRHELYRR